MAELYVAAHRSKAGDRWRARIEEQILPNIALAEFDLDSARIFGRLAAELMRAGTPVGETDVQIAAIALRHDLVLVTANVRHFALVPGLRLRLFRPGQ